MSNPGNGEQSDYFTPDDYSGYLQPQIETKPSQHQRRRFSRRAKVIGGLILLTGSAVGITLGVTHISSGDRAAEATNNRPTATASHKSGKPQHAGSANTSLSEAQQWSLAANAVYDEQRGQHDYQKDAALINSLRDAEVRNAANFALQATGAAIIVDHHNHEPFAGSFRYPVPSISAITNPGILSELHATLNAQGNTASEDIAHLNNQALIAAGAVYNHSPGG
jgi:hypothetical protein